MMNREALYKELYTALSSVEAVTGVFDEIAPSDQKGPYVVIEQAVEQQGRVIDDSEREISLNLHIWSSYKGKSEILMVFNAVENAMPKDYIFDDLQILRDGSGWFHGILGYHVYFRKD